MELASKYNNDARQLAIFPTAADFNHVSLWQPGHATIVRPADQGIQGMFSPKLFYVGMDNDVVTFL